MVDARPSRRILFYRGHIVPFKHLISPLLLVNFESRTCAKAFYNVKLDIYAVPPVSEDKVKLLNKKRYWDSVAGVEKAMDGKIHGYSDEWTLDDFEERRWRCAGFLSDWYGGETEEDVLREEARYTVDLEEHWSIYVSARLRRPGEASVAKVDGSGPTTGAFYISPEHDVFIADYPFGMHVCIDRASKILGADFPNLKATAYHHVSGKMPASARKQVSTVVLVRVAPSSGNTIHCVFARERTINPDRGLNPIEKYGRQPDTIWERRSFPRVRAYFVLRWNGRKPWHHFLDDLNDPDSAKLSECLEQWGREGSFTDDKGRVAWKLEMKKGDRYGFDKADWESDLMAHWDTTE